MKHIVVFVGCVILLVSIVLPVRGADPLYRDYGRLLSEYVCRGGVAYDMLAKHQSILDKAKAELTSVKRADIAEFSPNGQIAYYLNLYNLYTIDLIVRHLPIRTGIKDIENPWRTKFVPLFDDKVSLDNIETDILRKQYKDPRIHFALVCASKSCPALQNAPYTGDSLNMQLRRAAYNFLTDTTRNAFTDHTMNISMIFNWYGEDFKESFGSFSSYIATILSKPVGPNIHFNKYDWSLNKVERCP